MIYAIQEINKDPHILSNYTLGFKIFDSCYSETRAFQSAMSLLSGKITIPNYSCEKFPFVSGVVGDLVSSISITLGRIFGIYHFPQISHGASHSILSNKLQFPSFLRTISGTVYQDYALARLTDHYDWKWVGILTSDNSIGETSTQNLKREILKSNACIAFIEKINVQYSKQKIHMIAEMVINSSINIVIINCDEVYVKVILDAFYAINVTGKTMILSSHSTITPGFFTKETWPLLNGTLGLTPSSTDMLGFRDFLYSLKPSASTKDIFIRILWKEYFKCSWVMKNSSQQADVEEVDQELTYCTGQERIEELDVDLFELNSLSFTYHSYLAVYAFAHALNDLISCKAGSGPFINRSCTSIQDMQHWQVLHYVKDVHFNTRSNDEFYFDMNGDALMTYDIINVYIPTTDLFYFPKVGRVDPRALKGIDIVINTSAVIWKNGKYQIPRSVCSESCPLGYRRSIRRGQPVCCFDCSPCSAGEIANQTDMNDCLKCQEDKWPNDRSDKCIPKAIIFLSYTDTICVLFIAITVFFCFVTSSVLCIFIKYRDTPIVKANNRDLTYLLLFSLMLCFLCSLLFIGHPTKVTCILRQTVFGIIFSISISSVLAKTITVVIAFKATNPNSKLRSWVGTRIPYSLILCCILVQAVICTAWLLTSSPFPEMDVKSSSSQIILECNEGSKTFFYCMLGYMGLLAIVCFAVAFLARTLPDTFNEAKYITFSMLVFVSVWVSFIPAYLSTKGKYMVAVEIFAILSSSAGLLVCIFCFKCYIILLRSDLNNREHLTGRGGFSNNKRI
ncbi:vomeronasal type-2 receptor 26-like [Protopterus annectens]|uniref:vomeronasal type-2 receptor 26-like n=1 Tax=Protopterus annectens TaxID=7888 RepID=UPI001CF97078|nr:vomeronasal type-2 receptor 26-like [Protopterus annectens]